CAPCTRDLRGVGPGPEAFSVSDAWAVEGVVGVGGVFTPSVRLARHRIGTHVRLVTVSLASSPSGGSPWACLRSVSRALGRLGGCAGLIPFRVRCARVRSSTY